jgi:26S proteasome regulatory subunit N13
LSWQPGGVTEDDRIIFPGDAEFKYVEQARNNPKNPRVYVLKFQGSTERLFFWMQVECELLHLS